PSHYVSELSGLQQMAPNAKVEFIDGLSLDPSTSAWNTTDTAGNGVQGMKAEYFSNTNWSGDAAVTRTEQHVDLDWANDKNL
ncbi:beta-glucosidase, partial [Pseudomonas syringae pv. actinidiae ICMP 19096]